MALVWTPYWELVGKMSDAARAKGDYWYWMVSGAHVSSLRYVCGWEVVTQWFLTLFAALLLGPLSRHVLHASNGVTIMEADFSPIQDWVEIPGGRVLQLPAGSFSQGSRFANLRALLGPMWALRLAFPVGAVVAEDEAASPLSPEVAYGLRDIVAAAGKDNLRNLHASASACA